MEIYKSIRVSKVQAYHEGSVPIKSQCGYRYQLDMSTSTCWHIKIDKYQNIMSHKYSIYYFYFSKYEKGNLHIYGANGSV